MSQYPTQALPDSKGIRKKSAFVYEVDTRRFSRAVREQRGSLTLERAYEETRISTPVLSGIERGAMPSFKNYLRLCAWIGAEVSEFIEKVRG